jgi:hypothetical protein
MAPIGLGAAFTPCGDRGEGSPQVRAQLAVLAHIGPVEPLARRPSQMKRVLSEIHSSLIVLVDARQDAHHLAPRASTRMLEPTASITSMDSVFVSSHGRALKA